jgi:hypothetical protein
MLELLALLPDERIDRRGAEQLFDLRRSAAHELLRRFGALISSSLILPHRHS